MLTCKSTALRILGAGQLESHKGFDDWMDAEPLGVRLARAGTGVRRPATPDSTDNQVALPCDGAGPTDKVEMHSHVEAA